MRLWKSTVAFPASCIHPRNIATATSISSCILKCFLVASGSHRKTKYRITSAVSLECIHNGNQRSSFSESDFAARYFKHVSLFIERTTDLSARAGILIRYDFSASKRLLLNHISAIALLLYYITYHDTLIKVP